jgi:hypothetical protein
MQHRVEFIGTGDTLQPDPVTQSCAVCNTALTRQEACTWLLHRESVPKKEVGVMRVWLEPCAAHAYVGAITVPLPSPRPVFALPQFLGRMLDIGLLDAIADELANIFDDDTAPARPKHLHNVGKARSERHRRVFPPSTTS